VPNIHAQTRNQTHHSIEYDKSNFILHNWISPTSSHFRNSVYTSNSNSRVRGRDRYKQSLEFRRGAERESRRVPLAAIGADFKEDIEGETAEDGEGRDLRTEPDHHYVVADRGFGGGAGSDDGAETLDYDGGDVGEDEDPGVETRGETGEFAAVDYDSGSGLGWQFVVEK
jgi:hypothetical protein